MATTTCTHLDEILPVAPSGPGCVECMATGGRWVHLRRCTECGHVGCCDQSPGKHATAHFGSTQHPIIQSYRAPRGLVLVLRRRADVRHRRTAAESVASVNAPPEATPNVRFATPAGRWVIAAAVLGSGVAFLDSTVVNAALPAIGKDFHADLADLQWVLTGYLLTLGSLLVSADRSATGSGAEDVRDRAVRLRGGVTALRDRPVDGDADRGARTAGRRCGAAGSRQPRDHLGVVPPR